MLILEIREKIWTYVMKLMKSSRTTFWSFHFIGAMKYTIIDLIWSIASLISYQLFESLFQNKILPYKFIKKIVMNKKIWPLLILLFRYFTVCYLNSQQNIAKFTYDPREFHLVNRMYVLEQSFRLIQQFLPGEL